MEQTQQKNDIQIADIEKEIARLREARQGNGQMHACLFNLVVYSQDKSRAEFLKFTVKTIISKFPCRVMFLQREAQSKESFLSVNVANEVVNKIACDVITIEASQDLVDRMPFIVLPHFVADLPIFFLWDHDPTKQDPVLSELARLANRLIFTIDASVEHLKMVSQRILQIKASRPYLQITDINWAVINSWRTVLKELFDNPEDVERFKKANTLKIYYENTKTNKLNNPIQPAFYLVSWLASRFKHSLKQVSANEFIFGNKRAIFVGQKYSDVPAGSILKAELSLENEFNYLFEPILSQSKIVVHFSTAKECSLPLTLPLPNLRGEFQLAKEILFSSISSQYTETIQTISEMEFKGLH